MLDRVWTMTGLAASVAFWAMMSAPFPALAASLSNQDGEAHTLIVTEDGLRYELVVGAGETVSFCNAGCFLILPSGDRAALAGSESLAIVAGEVVVNF